MTTLPMVDFESREQFEKLLVEYRRANQMWPEQLALQNVLEDELLARHHVLRPKAKLKIPPQVDAAAEVSVDNIRAMRERWEKVCKLLKGVLPDEEFTETMDRFRKLSDEREKGRSIRRRALQDQLTELAMKLTPRRGETWNMVELVDFYRFSSQGGSSGAYARTAAELRCLDFMEGGLDSRIRHRPRNTEFPAEGYEVWVKAGAVDIEIVKFGHALLLPDWLQQVHCRAMNPRALMPGLPWGLEERYGIKEGLAAKALLRPVGHLNSEVDGVPQGTSP